MTRHLRIWLAAAGLAAAMPAAGAEWRAAEKVETYAISGDTGIALYRSIGERGPKVGVGRAIAYTDFELLWSRDYRQQADGSCLLASARPSLTITYRLPKPSGKLPAATRGLWESFIEGVEAHERVHGDFIREMVGKIEAVSVGLSVADDPECRKIRKELTGRLAALSQEQRQRSRDFDRAEMSDGGTVHRLVLALVNG